LIISRKHFIFIFKFGIAAVIVCYLFSSGKLTPDLFLHLIDTSHSTLLVLSGAAFFLAQMLASYRLLILLRMIDLNLPYIHIIKLTMIGNFFNIVTPGMFGGDIAKVAYLFKSEDERRGRSSGIVLMDRLVGFVAMLFMAAVSIGYLYWKKQLFLTPFLLELKWGFAIIVCLLLLFALFVIYAKKQQVRIRAQALASRLFKESALYHMTHAIGALTKRRRTLIFAFCLSLAFHTIALGGLLLLVSLVPGNPPNYIDLLAASSIVQLFGIIPVTPGNIGWTELVASIGWSMVGSNTGGFIFFYWRIVSVIFSLPGGVLYLLLSHSFLKITKRSDN
jgi:uncharacterized protein (TIRG00374 family)